LESHSPHSAVDYVKLAANRVLFAVVYVIAFCLSMAKSLLGLTMVLADDFLHRVAKLLALPVGFSLAMIDLLRMGFAALKVGPSTVFEFNALQLSAHAVTISFRTAARLGLPPRRDASASSTKARRSPRRTSARPSGRRCRRCSSRR
jgi:hypothetical protein